MPQKGKAALEVKAKIVEDYLAGRIRRVDIKQKCNIHDSTLDVGLGEIILGWILIRKTKSIPIFYETAIFGLILYK